MSNRLDVNRVFIKARKNYRPSRNGDQPEVSQDYNMGRRGGSQERHRYNVPTWGAGADFHVRNRAKWLWQQELAWDMFRNDCCLGSITNRAVTNIVQGGFKYNADTGDTGVDAAIEEWFEESRLNKKECDPAEEYNFIDQEKIVARSCFVAGDIFAIPIRDTGAVGMKESYLCQTPYSGPIGTEYANITMGIKRNPSTRKYETFYFVPESIDPFRQTGWSTSNMEPMRAYDQDGNPLVWHVKFPSRAHETRGVTAYSPIYNLANYHDDIQFAKVVQARGTSLFGFIRERERDFDPDFMAAEADTLGRNVTDDKAEWYERNAGQYRETRAGAVFHGLPGEKILPWSAGVPNMEFFPHMKGLLTLIGVNLGMPLVMVLMDGSETNYSGWRGAVTQAYMVFRDNQRELISRFHQPWIHFKLTWLAANDAQFRGLLERTDAAGNFDLYRGRWDPPSWPYVDPEADAKADAYQIGNTLTSPRRLCRKRDGSEWSKISEEYVQDLELHMVNCLEAAGRVMGRFPDLKEHVDLFGLLKMFYNIPMAERTQLSMSSTIEKEEEPEPTETNRIAEPSSNGNR